MAAPLHLFSAARSSASYRVRIALNLKGLAYDQTPIDLRAGEQRSPAFKAHNPQGLVPALIAGNLTLTQSPAIIEWLDETYPQPALLPADRDGRARVRALAAIIACDIHPINNLRILGYLQHQLGLDEATRNTWYRHWVNEGFAALETLLEQGGSGDFCHGEAPGLADLHLVPQVFNALRYDVDLAPYPRIRRIDAACRALPAFIAAAPERQPGF
ncbi:MAG: maleylacetoacetate isomerase [Alphaproteobacteria bacterium]|jgi:maleylacetoacetate isomerase|nr:maleylacetoacetate isomerase [Alphaproteobacteria bacterium]